MIVLLLWTCTPQSLIHIDAVQRGYEIRAVVDRIVIDIHTGIARACSHKLTELIVEQVRIAQTKLVVIRRLSLVPRRVGLLVVRSRTELLLIEIAELVTIGCTFGRLEEGRCQGRLLARERRLLFRSQMALQYSQRRGWLLFFDVGRPTLLVRGQQVQIHIVEHNVLLHLHLDVDWSLVVLNLL